MTEMRPYTDDPDLALFVFEESYVLGFAPTADGFAFDLDVAPSSTHPRWHPPPPEDAITWWRGRLVFTMCEALRFEPSRRPPAIDANRETDFGSIDTFLLDGPGFVLEGEWGRLTMSAGTASVEVDDAAAPAE